jgi:cathepsin L
MAMPTELLSFSDFAKTFGKTYASREEQLLRRNIFAANLQRIAAHNADSTATYKMAVNQFADLTAAEFKGRYASGYRAQEHKSANVNNALLTADVMALPTSVDWTTKGAVTPVKNQGQCGSCWAFSTTGSTEGINFLKTGQLVSLSEQQLVDCSGAEGNMGCNGGLMDDAFKYIISNNGICSEASYPYTAADGTCQKCTNVVTITGYTDVPADSETALMTAIAQQPVSVAIEADQMAFQFYSSGVLTGKCGTALDHGVLAVGYGTSSAGVGYYLVKNSWGASWGMAGYVQLARGGNSYNGAAGQCGIQSQPSYPTKTN